MQNRHLKKSMRAYINSLISINMPITQHNKCEVNDISKTR